MAACSTGIEMAMKIESNKSVSAFAIIVDINSFNSMVAASGGLLIAQFTRDVLAGAIEAIEEESGEVVSFMGDGIFGLVPTAETAFRSCVRIAKDLDQQCAYISGQQNHTPQGWGFAPGGPSLKVGVEYGTLDVSLIRSRCLGQRKLVIGDAINYAARITSPGEGNRCHIGPRAAANGLQAYPLSRLHRTKGKPGEGTYTYYKLDLSDTWIEGKRKKGADTHR
jgi:class 3 adenylate cyclase